ncbi:hypothetical protein KOI40_03075 [Aestuariicella sp. G3-2]|uniref:hypothetical protein n=1 Tax=Pseudomaricurvus albidus TaxID=2842452 RepID=UPI001C0C9FE7|nr:hypothetical protein [Aestuariicella albida]MBU3068784.1 hypothetical protein [Aestuariicella albida]
MSIGQVLKCELYGASIARMDGGQVYASLYVGQPVVNEAEENAKGIVLMKIACDEQVYKDLKAPAYPCPVDMHVRLKKAAGGKMGQHCFKLDFPQPAKPAPTQQKAS